MNIGRDRLVNNIILCHVEYILDPFVVRLGSSLIQNLQSLVLRLNGIREHLQPEFHDENYLDEQIEACEEEPKSVTEMAFRGGIKKVWVVYLDPYAQINHILVNRKC